ncbi:MAG: ABC transporter ATP-binding protein [Chloroflexi bacterium]|nr:ABC transporter ATP-binding protein [Chloroflexota bacterium]
MIITEDLSKSFDTFVAVDGISLTVGKGEVLALLGPNGAGKTTTVRMLTSILKPTRGRATVAGFDVVKQASQVRSMVGVLTEHHGLYNRMRATEYLDFFGQIYGLDSRRRMESAERLLTLFDLMDAKERRIGEYSKGMRQKLALARAMLHDPQVLLLDEPTSAMDPASARLVRDSIRNLRSSERTVVICTHNLAEAEELADRIAIIRQGRIVARGSVPALKERLVGPAVYVAEFYNGQGEKSPDLPGEVAWERMDRNHIRFTSPDPATFNPLVLERLLAQGFPVVSLEELPRSLEEVYLQAVLAADGESLDA